MTLADKVLSVVVVTVVQGQYTATLRFNEPMFDRILSANSYYGIHATISDYLSRKC